MKKGCPFVQPLLAMACAVCLLMAGSGCSNARPVSLSAEEIETIMAADQAYATAWLANEPERVMATLTDDAALVPSGMEVMEGADDIRAFWWPPDSPLTTVIEFSLVQQEAGGSGDVGFVRGSFLLAFEYDGAAHSSSGEYFSLLRRLPDGSWRISHRMWSDRPRQAS